MPRPRVSLEAHECRGTVPQYVTPDVHVESGRPKYPRGISGEARSAYKRLVKLLEARRSLTAGDQELLHIYAILFDRHKKALAKVAEEGEIKIYYRLDNHGESVPSEKPNLWLKIAQDSESKMIACLDRLGLTPINRGKVKPADPPKDQQTDPRDAMLTREGHKDAEPSTDILDDIPEDLLQ